jgi:hypothetical protein
MNCGIYFLMVYVFLSLALFIEWLPVLVVEEALVL